MTTLPDTLQLLFLYSNSLTVFTDCIHIFKRPPTAIDTNDTETLYKTAITFVEDEEMHLFILSLNIKDIYIAIFVTENNASEFF